MRGFLARSLVGEARMADDPVADDDVVSACDCVCVSVCAGWLGGALDAFFVVVLSLELPQPATTRAAAASAGARTFRDMRREASDDAGVRSRRGDSNPWPIAYKAIALPAELLRPGAGTLSGRDGFLEPAVPVGADDVVVVGDLLLARPVEPALDLAEHDAEHEV